MGNVPVPAKEQAPEQCRGWALIFCQVGAAAVLGAGEKCCAACELKAPTSRLVESRPRAMAWSVGDSPAAGDGSRRIGRILLCSGIEGSA